MILSAHQPAYLPWLGYFDKLLRSDVFVFLDTVQYEKNSFTNRNKVKTPNGAVWLTVPVKAKGHLSSSLKQLSIDNTQKWRQNHLKTIYLNYKKAPRFEECYPRLESLYAKEFESLTDLCFEHLQFWISEMDSNRKIIKLSDLPINTKKSDLILDLCKHFGAGTYISGALGKDYLDEESFSKEGIKIEYQDYKHPTYGQLWGEFLPTMGFVDFWMNCSDYWLITGETKGGFFTRMGNKL